MPRRVLILMSNTGGGHRSAAQAIIQALTHLYGDEYQAEMVDALLNYTPFPINRFVGWYQPFVDRALPLWKLTWRSAHGRQRVRWIMRLARPYVQRRLKGLLQRPQPDVVVSVHPLLNHLPLGLMRAHGWRMPFVTVVTDPVSVHAIWFCPEVDLCLVATEAARKQALRAGLSQQKVRVIGMPVSLEFAREKPEKQELRRKLGLRADEPAILLVSGGEGMGPLYGIARAIAQARPPGQLCIVTGRNAKLRQRLEQVDWEIPATVFGFVDNMPEIMGACDLIVTKAGPGTIAESLTCGLPLVLSGYIPDQETGNVRWVVEGGAGVYTPDPARIATTVREWLCDGNGTLALMSGRARVLSRPQAALDIARAIHELVNERNQETGQ